MENQGKIERAGITLAGNILTDVVKDIAVYPEIGMLANITRVTNAVGGCVPNTGIDLATMDPTLAVSAIGLVGEDAYGRFVTEKMRQSGINVDGVTVTAAAPTGFTDVMSLPSGERTFFHARGANALFAPEQITLSKLHCRMLHVGYIFLLDRFDAPDPEYGTAMARFLASVRRMGIRTSVDVASDDQGDYPGKIKPVLPHCDNLIINEIECCRIWGIPPTRDGETDFAAIRRAMELTMEAGVHEHVIVHCKEAGFLLGRDGRFTAMPSLDLPQDAIKGSVGAGDAFCAGALYALYHGYDDEHLLRYASASAACSLFAENSVDGMRSRAQIEQLEQKYPRKDLPALKEASLCSSI